MKVTLIGYKDVKFETENKTDEVVLKELKGKTLVVTGKLAAIDTWKDL